MVAIAQSQRRALNVPGPRPTPIIGAYGNLLSFARDPLNKLGELFRTYGRVVALVSGAPTRVISPYKDCPGTVFVYGPELNREVVTDHDNYQKSALTGGMHNGQMLSRRKQLLWNFGTGLFHVNGDAHRQHRRLLMPAFHKKQIETYRDDMVAITRQMLDTWMPSQQRDMREDMSFLTLCVAGKTLFGEDILNNPDSIGSTMQTMVKLLLSPTGRFFNYDIPGTRYQRLLDVSEQADREIRQQIAEKRAH